MVMFVCGSRRFSGFATMIMVLEKVLKDQPIVREVWHGAARGADTLAGRWAEARGLTVKAWPVTDEDWAKSRRAGLDRNVRMIASLPSDSLCVAFLPDQCRQAEGWTLGLSLDSSPGTAHAVTTARRHGFMVHVVWPSGEVVVLRPFGRHEKPGDVQPRTWRIATRSVPAEADPGDFAILPNGRRHKIVWDASDHLVLGPVDCSKPPEITDWEPRDKFTRGFGDRERRGTQPGYSASGFWPSGAMKSFCDRCGRTVGAGHWCR